MHMTKEEVLGTPLRQIEREISEDQATTNMMLRFDRADRRGQRDLADVQERYSIMVKPLREHADYTDLASKHARIAATRAKLEEDLREARMAYERGVAAFNKNKLERQAQAIIDGTEGDPMGGFEELKTRCARLDAEVGTYSHAQNQVWAQMQAIKSERSIDAEAAIRPAHVLAVGAVADACAALLAALNDERLIRQTATHAGYDDRLPVFQGIKDAAELGQRAEAYAR